MKTIALLVATLVFLGLWFLIGSWAAIDEFRHYKVLKLDRVEQSEGEISGVHVMIDQQRAMILPQADNQAVVYLRLRMKGKPEDLAAWQTCELALTDTQGRKWLPTPNDTGREAIKNLADGVEDDADCVRSLWRAPADGSPFFSQQAFIMPADALKDLRLQVSSVKSRPTALSLPFKPVLRQPPA